jgi:hypothetical protein
MENGIVRWSYSLFCLLSNIFVFHLPYYYTWDFFPNLTIALVLNVILVGLDFAISDSAWYNRKVLHHNGYHDGYLAFFFLTTTLISYGNFFSFREMIPTFPEIHFDLPFGGWLLFNLGVGLF